MADGSSMLTEKFHQSLFLWSISLFCATPWVSSWFSQPTSAPYFSRDIHKLARSNRRQHVPPPVKLQCPCPWESSTLSHLSVGSAGSAKW